MPDWSDDPNSNDESSLDIWGMLWRRKWIVLSCIFLGLICGFLYYYSATPIYRSNARVLIERKQPPLQMGSTTGRVDRYEAITENMKHPIVMRSPQIISNAFNDNKLVQCDSLKRLQNPLGTLLDKLSVGPVQEGLGVFEVAYTGTDPHDTQKVVTAVLSAYQGFLEDTHRNVSREMREMITRSKDELLRELTTKEKAYGKFRAESPLMFKEGMATNLHQQRQASIEASRGEIQLEITQLESQLESIKQSLANGDNLEGIIMMAATALPGLTRPVSRLNPYEYQQEFQRESYSRQARQQIVAREQSMLMPLKIQEEELTSRYGKDHPRVKSLRRSIVRAEASLRQMIALEKDYLNLELGPSAEERRIEAFEVKLRAWRNSIVRGYVHSLRQRLTDAREQNDKLNILYEQEKDAAKKLAVFEATDETHRKNIERTQELFDSVKGNLDQVNLLENGDGYTFSVISPAGVGRKVAPSLPKAFVLSVLLGSLLGGGISFVLEKVDQSFHSPMDISDCLQIPVIGNVPVIQVDEQAKSPETASLADVVCTAHRPRSLESEAYRTVRTAIFFDARGSDHHVLQITSPRPGDGKSTLAANLAVAVAQSGKSTLLIDADFRRPTAHKVFGFRKSVGMATVVNGNAEPEEALTAIDCVPNLTVIGCGHRPDNPSELLSSKEFLSTLEYFKERFDFVIVDTPPLLAVSDPRAVAASVDAVVMTMRIDKEARPTATRATEILRECGANIVGIVVNGIGNGKQGYYNYGGGRYSQNAYRYGYGTSYGYGDDYVEESEHKTAANQS